MIEPTTQELILALTGIADNPAATIHDNYRNLLRMSAERLRAMQAREAELRFTIKQQKQAMQWQKVTGGLPPEGDRVIVSVDDEIRLGSAFGGMMLADDGDGATHWMPPPPTTVGRAMSELKCPECGRAVDVDEGPEVDRWSSEIYCWCSIDSPMVIAWHRKKGVATRMARAAWAAMTEGKG